MLGGFAGGGRGGGFVEDLEYPSSRGGDGKQPEPGAGGDTAGEVRGVSARDLAEEQGGGEVVEQPRVEEGLATVDDALAHPEQVGPFTGKPGQVSEKAAALGRTTYRVKLDERRSSDPEVATRGGSSELFQGQECLNEAHRQAQKMQEGKPTRDSPEVSNAVRCALIYNGDDPSHLDGRERDLTMAEAQGLLGADFHRFGSIGAALAEARPGVPDRNFCAIMAVHHRNGSVSVRNVFKADGYVAVPNAGRGELDTREIEKLLSEEAAGLKPIAVYVARTDGRKPNWDALNPS